MTGPQTPRVDALMAIWGDDGASRGAAFIELRDLARSLEQVVRLFMGAAIPVSTIINEKGYAWSGAYLEGARKVALELPLEQFPPGTRTCGNCDGKGVIYQCVICASDTAGAGSCGSLDPRALCRWTSPARSDALYPEYVRHLEQAHTTRGSFFGQHPVPLLTDRQDREARAGVCPTCQNQTLADMGRGEGLRFLGCGACQAVVVLPSRADDRQLVMIQPRRAGRTYMAQQVQLAMRMYDADGYCSEGDRCNCGGDTPAVRASCSRWVKP